MLLWMRLCSIHTVQCSSVGFMDCYLIAPNDIIKGVMQIELPSQVFSFYFPHVSAENRPFYNNKSIQVRIVASETYMPLSASLFCKYYVLKNVSGCESFPVKSQYPLHTIYSYWLLLQIPS